MIASLSNKKNKIKELENLIDELLKDSKSFSFLPKKLQNEINTNKVKSKYLYAVDFRDKYLKSMQDKELIELDFEDTVLEFYYHIENDIFYCTLSSMDDDICCPTCGGIGVNDEIFYADDYDDISRTTFGENIICKTCKGKESIKL